MQIPRSYIEGYSNALNQISSRARESLSNALMQIDYDMPIADIRNAVIAVMQVACGASSTMSARLAADFYDGLRASFGIADEYKAVPDSQRVPEATSGAVRAFVQDLVDNKPLEQFVGKCTDRIDYETRKAANECVASNAKNDPKKPRWARIPTGIETCKFCIMLASRGFVYHTEETASHAHANCDCRVVPSWDKSPLVQGYDPELYYDMWKHPEKYEDSKVKTAFSVNDIGTAPKRPKRGDYGSDDDYQAARENYRKEREEFNMRKEALVDELENRPTNGYETKEAAMQWAQKRGVVIDDDVFAKIDLRTVDEIITTTDKLFDKYPIVLQDKESTGSKYTIRLGESGESYFMEASGGLNLNLRYFRTRQDTVTFVVDGYSSVSYNEYVGRDLRGLVRGDGTFSTSITHEFGHNLDEAIRWSRFHNGDDIDYDGLIQYKQDLQKLTLEHTTSEYSTVNEWEAFAEGFAEYECNPGSEYAEAFGKFLRRWL